MADRSYPRLAFFPGLDNAGRWGSEEANHDVPMMARR
jgi:hypothetical protein